MNYFPSNPHFVDGLHLVVPVDEDGEVAARPLVINTGRAALTSDPGAVLAKGMAGDIICMWEIHRPSVMYPHEKADTEHTCGSVPSWEPDYVFGILDGNLVVELDREIVADFERRPVHT